MVFYIGLGHCNETPGEDCLDPLVQDALFVLEEKGKPWSEIRGEDVCHPWPKPKSKECSKVAGFWWRLSVYLDRQAFANPGNPTYEGLPCWAKLACAGDMSTDGGKRRQEAMEECQGAQAMAKSDLAIPQSVGDLESESERLTAESFTKVEVEAALTPLPTSTPTPVWQGGSTIKLGTFNPIPRKFAYEWWTPSCKPAIYLYPEKPTRLRVRVEPEGELARTIPEHGEEGWEVVAYPDGSIIRNTRYETQDTKTKYPYLFYEANIRQLRVPEHGWVVKQEELGEFFGWKLEELGLVGREISDFREYWEKKLTETPYYFVGLLSEDELNRIERIDFSPEPDTFIRVRFVFEKLFAPLSIEPPVFPDKPARDGFVAIDWGGVLIDGSCEELIVDHQKIE